MKNLLTLFLAVIFAAGIAGQLQAQKSFEGTVKYKVKFVSDQISPQMEAMMPKFVNTMIRGNKSRTEMQLPMGSVIQIQDGDEQKLIVLMDNQGNKTAQVKNIDEIKESWPDNMEVDVRKVNEIKEIAGYECKKAVVTIKQGDEKQRMTVYYSPELGNSKLNFDNPMYRDIDGLLMQFNMNDNGIELEMMAVEVKKKHISKKMFEIPKEYTTPPKGEIRENPAHNETEID